MPQSAVLPSPDSFVTFGALLRYLRRRAGLTQGELAAAAGYSEAQISRLEHNRRAPEPSVVRARFLPALLANDLQIYAPRLLALAEPTHAEQAAERPAPAQPAELIGRIGERAELQRMLAGDARLVTLIGPPGVGKTRLARHVAHSVSPLFPGSVRFVDLTAVADPARVLLAIAQTLGADIDSEANHLRRLVAAFDAGRALLVLDNFEQLLPAAPQLAALLAAAPQLTLLVTSRAPLHLPLEQRFALAPLALPSDPNMEPGLLGSVESVALLVRRLRDADAAFRLDATNAATIAAICAEVDGLPLALELVAAHGRLLAPSDLLEQVARHPHRLARRSNGQTTHHDSMLRTLDWSVALLPPATQTLFNQLAVFVGGWTFGAAAAVCGAGDPALLEGLETLLDHNLVQHHHRAEHTRFSMLVTVRAYAGERLTASGEEAELRQRHAAYFLAVAEQAERELVGPQQQAWYGRIADDLENMRAALAWSCEHDPMLGLRLASALERFWYTRGYGFEGQRWIEQLLGHAPLAEVPGPVLAGALTVAGILAYRAGDYEQATERLQRGLQHYHMLEDDENIARIRNNLGNVALDQGLYGAAAEHYAASLLIRRAIGHPRSIASSLNNLAEVTRVQGDFAAARAYFAESLSLYQQIGETWSIASVLSNTATVAYQQGNYADARALYEESLAIREDLGDKPGRARVLNGLGNVARACGDEQQAEMRYGESLELHTEVPDAASLASAFVGLASLVARRAPERAARLLGAASAQMERHGIKADQIIHDDYERVLAVLHALLGERQSQIAWRAGHSFADAQAIAYARGASPHNAGQPAVAR